MHRDRLGGSAKRASWMLGNMPRKDPPMKTGGKLKGGRSLIGDDQPEIMRGGKNAGDLSCSKRATQKEAFVTRINYGERGKVEYQSFGTRCTTRDGEVGRDTRDAKRKVAGRVKTKTSS